MIYLDSAATTLQKPPAVAAAVCSAMARAASPGRGGHPWGMEAAKIAFHCRETAAKLFCLSDPERVVFTFNATHGLNIAIRSVVKPGSTVLISGYEHNAVSRALYSIPDVRLRVALSAPFDQKGMLCSFRDELARGVDAVVCTHVSNVFGFILPVEEIGKLCRKYDVPLIIDASQSAGCLTVDFAALGAQYIAMPGHKGLYGPQGTGILLCGKEGEPILFGGTGSISSSQEMPDFLPDRLEAGTPNIPGIAGLYEGMRFVSRHGVRRLGERESGLIRLLGNRLRTIPGVYVWMAEDPRTQSAVLSFSVRDSDCEQVGEWLGQHHVAVRAGLHCAPIAHQSAGTLEQGTVRASASAFTTRQEVERAACLIAQFCARR